MPLSLYLASLPVSAGVGYEFHHSSPLNSAPEGRRATALQLVDAFVTAYAHLRPKLGPDAPVPATFRAH